MDTPDITRCVVFRDYNTAGLDRFEVCASEGVISMSQNLPDELSAWQARCVAHMLLRAAAELEGQG
jgi:hypothetical protein